MSFFTTLQVDRTREFFVTVKSAAGYARNFLVINDGLAVLNDGDHSPYQGDVESLPLSDFPRQLRRGRNKSVYPAGMVAGRFLIGIGFNLDFVASAQINATVRFFVALELNVQLEVLKFRVADKLWSAPRSNESALFDLPVRVKVRRVGSPAG